MPPRKSSAVNWYIGIDPGASGGLAAIPGGDGRSPTSDFKIQLTKMPPTDADILAWLRTFLPGSSEGYVFAFIEKVSGYVSSEGGQAKGAQPGSAMFKFGASYGGLKMALTALEIPYREVSPAPWQKDYLSSRKKGESRSSWKNRIKSVAMSLFPSVSSTITLSTADALLIADAARRYATYQT